MKTVQLILFPQFQMLAYVLATETLRLANKCAGFERFRWQTLTSTNAPVAASNGAVVHPDSTDWRAGQRPDLILLCAGYDPLDHLTGRCRAYLARMRRAGVLLGGLDTGSVILAELGLLNGYRAVLHHEAERAFKETWPEIEISDQIYCLDGPRLTAAGGTATGDAMLAWIGSVAGAALARSVSDAMVHGRIRASDAPQRLSETTDPELLAMKRAMREGLSSPIPISDLARQLGLSMKQLRRRCRMGFGATPSQVYLQMRLENAQDLLIGTQLSVTEISVATGFGSPSAFSRAFRRHYRQSPRDRRANAQALPA